MTEVFRGTDITIGVQNSEAAQRRECRALVGGRQRESICNGFSVYICLNWSLKDGQVIDKRIPAFWVEGRNKAMEYSHLATSCLPPYTAKSLEWLVGSVTVHTVHGAYIGDLEMTGWQEVKLESCGSRQRKTWLYGSPRHLDSILWQSKSLKVIELGSHGMRFACSVDNKFAGCGGYRRRQT